MRVLIVNKFLFPKGGDAISALKTGGLLNKQGHRVNFWGMEHHLNPGYRYEDYFVSNVDFNGSANLKDKLIMSLNEL